MMILLHIIASARGELSHSRRAGQAAAQALLTQCPSLTLIERNLGRFPIPHPDARFVEASLMPEDQRGDAQHAALTLSETLIDELDTADFVVLSTPMHNFTVPSVLKAWLDHIVRPRRTFRITASGKIGLLRDRPVRILLACGGALGDAAEQIDFATPYLRYVFATIGITDLQVLPLENLNRGAGAQAVTQASLHAWLDRFSSRAVTDR
ncbi:NAD(P)H-dependent oxidoreductase [Acidiferrobacter thiooxydans]|uniref:FMN-dependent NADH-azoreductase n=1 Tax=Acidiferrobacter thiooxydans TaxID=163359 RepID=UPI000824D296|nr:NAD(P)H-dependent oxidoreductase [Acidiferrobacter thiooxydans]UEO01209.1 NAD(P)H-dependent oxidoreductase [Acidiferrobacter thiooxydans]